MESPQSGDSIWNTVEHPEDHLVLLPDRDHIFIISRLF